MQGTRDYDYSSISPELSQKAARIEWLVLDVDGVMTDGTLGRSDDGQENKRFHARDGFGLKMWRKAGLSLAIITARESATVEHRADELGASELYQGCNDKLQALMTITERQELGAEKIAYIGDDLVDYRAMRFAGLAITVADAYPMMHEISDWSSAFNGGSGAVRDACELILHCKGLRTQLIESYTSHSTTRDGANTA